MSGFVCIKIFNHQSQQERQGGTRLATDCLAWWPSGSNPSSTQDGTRSRTSPVPARVPSRHESRPGTSPVPARVPSRLESRPGSSPVPARVPSHGSSPVPRLVSRPGHIGGCGTDRSEIRAACRGSFPPIEKRIPTPVGIQISSPAGIFSPPASRAEIRWQNLPPFCCRSDRRAHPSLRPRFSPYVFDLGPRLRQALDPNPIVPRVIDSPSGNFRVACLSASVDVTVDVTDAPQRFGELHQ
jgi:hypothetical protein